MFITKHLGNLQACGEHSVAFTCILKVSYLIQVVYSLYRVLYIIYALQRKPALSLIRTACPKGRLTLTLGLRISGFCTRHAEPVTFHRPLTNRLEWFPCIRIAYCDHAHQGWLSIVRSGFVVPPSTAYSHSPRGHLLWLTMRERNKKTFACH